MDPFTAIAEPTRRKILDLLLVQSLPAGEIVAKFPTLSQPAISRHLRVLSQAGLVQIEPRAQQRIYSLCPTSFAELENWLIRYSRFWNQSLDQLEQHLHSKHGPPNNLSLNT